MLPSPLKLKLLSTYSSRIFPTILFGYEWQITFQLWSSRTRREIAWKFYRGGGFFFDAPLNKDQFTYSRNGVLCAIRVNMCPLGGTLRELVLSLLPKEEARDWKLFARAHVPPLPWSSDARDAKRIFSRIIFTWGTFSPRRNILERVEYRWNFF